MVRRRTAAAAGANSRRRPVDLDVGNGARPVVARRRTFSLPSLTSRQRRQGIHQK